MDFATIFFTENDPQLHLQPPNIEDQVPVFMSTSDRVTLLYPQALGSLFVAFCDSQGYDGGILTCLHIAKLIWLLDLII
jgi:hypothetical protein